MIFLHKGFDGSAEITNAETGAMPRITDRIVGPWQHDITQRSQRRLEGFIRGSAPGATGKDRITDNDPVIVFQDKADLIINVARRIGDAQGTLTDGDLVTGIEPAVGGDVAPNRIGVS